jgi:hypothetical protein
MFGCFIILKVKKISAKKHNKEIAKLMLFFLESWHNKEQIIGRKMSRYTAVFINI